MNWPRALRFAALCWVVGIAAGTAANAAWHGSGALFGVVTALSVAIAILCRWKDALYTAVWQCYRKIHEAEAMALLAPKDELPYLPWSIWALAPDAILRVLGFARINRWTTVVECGSGISTVLLAREFKARASGHVYALEDDPAWCDLVREMLAERGLSNWATVVHAPLVETTVDGMSFRWYDRGAIEHVLALPKIDALIVDGPKGATGSLARYPALPIFRHQLGESFMLLLDDGHRADETEIARLWRNRYNVAMSLRDTSRGQWEYVSTEA